MSTKNSPLPIDVGRILQTAVLAPVDYPHEQNCFAWQQLPTWWSDKIGVVHDDKIELVSPVLVDFLPTAFEAWRQTDQNVIVASILFESESSQAEAVQLQGLAGKQDGRPFLLVRNLAVMDDWITSVLRGARENLFQQSKERSHHRREVASISADRDEAKRLEQAKSQFLANMSHEVRTPLTTILGMASMAQNTTEDPAAQQEYLNGVVSAANRLLRLSNDILDLSRIQADKLELDNVPFSLHEAMREFEQIWQLHASKKSLTFELKIDPNTPDNVIGDPFRLRQVLTNLVNNALKFTIKGGISLKIYPTPEGKQQIRFEVQDTGVGISPQQQSRIFETFTQVDESPTRRHQGAGLGLAIAGNLTRLMGSAISVQSEPGEGSCFSFDALLPSTNAPSAKAASNEVDSSDETTATKSTADNSLRVLVAEDHALNRSIIVETLRGEGIETVEAENGKVAVDVWRKQAFDVVLMDCQMPVMSGLEAIDAIREEENDEKKHTPIIALTAHAMNEEKYRLLDHGADRYMAKPFDREKLVAMVHELGRE